MSGLEPLSWSLRVRCSLAKVLPLTPSSLCFRQYFSAETFLC